MVDILFGSSSKVPCQLYFDLSQHFYGDITYCGHNLPEAEIYQYRYIIPTKMARTKKTARVVLETRKTNEAEGRANRPADHIELLFQGRREFADNLRPSNVAVISIDDIEQNIREILVILITNAEIFDRFMESRKEDSYSEFT